VQVAESGARVIATARNIDKAPGLKALAQAHARERLQVVALDVTDAASLRVRRPSFRLSVAETCTAGLLNTRVLAVCQSPGTRAKRAAHHLSRCVPVRHVRLDGDAGRACSSILDWHDPDTSTEAICLTLTLREFLPSS